MIETTKNTPATKAPKQWRASSRAIKPRTVVQGMINLVLVIWAVRDIRRRGDDEIKGNRKIWMVAAFAPPIGPIAYFLFGRKRGASS